MPPLLTAGLDPGDRQILGVLGAVFLLLVVATVIVAPPAESEDNGIPSTYSSGAGGARAAYLLLKDLNYPMERWERPAGELPQDANGSILILADPVFPFSQEDIHAVHMFLRAGGTILATGMRATRVLPEEAAETAEPFENEWKEYAARLPSPLTRGAEEIELKTGAHWHTAKTSHVALYGEDEKAVVITYPTGKGRVIWWASSTPLTNAGISVRKNLNLFLNALGRPGQRRILWDEYSHGQRGSIWSYLGRTPVPWGGLQLGLLAMALLFTFARRSGPVRPLVRPSRLTPLEFVEALGGLYHRAHAAPSAVGVALQRFRFLLARRLGLAASSSAAELANAARERLGMEAEQLDNVLLRAEQAAKQPKLGDSDALRLVQALDGYAERLALKHATPSLATRARPGAPSGPPNDSKETR